MGDTSITAAFGAARDGDLSTLERLADGDPGLLDAREANGMTLLHIAAERDDAPMVRALLARGADAALEAEWGQTPLEWAANVNAAQSAAELLDSGGERPSLWTAAALGMLPEVSARFEHGRTPAPEEGRVPRPGAKLDGWTAETAFLRADPVSDAFYIACRNGRLAVARYLRARGADLNARGYFGAPALHWAAGGGHAEVVEWLIAEGADPTIRDPEFGSDAAGWAREFGHSGLADRIEAISPRRADDEHRRDPPALDPDQEEHG